MCLFFDRASPVIPIPFAAREGELGPAPPLSAALTKLPPPPLRFFPSGRTEERSMVAYYSHMARKSRRSVYVLLGNKKHRR